MLYLILKKKKEIQDVHTEVSGKNTLLSFTCTFFFLILISLYGFLLNLHSADDWHVFTACLKSCLTDRAAVKHRLHRTKRTSDMHHFKNNPSGLLRAVQFRQCCLCGISVAAPWLCLDTLRSPDDSKWHSAELTLCCDELSWSGSHEH